MPGQRVREVVAADGERDQARHGEQGRAANAPAVGAQARGPRTRPAGAPPAARAPRGSSTDGRHRHHGDGRARGARRRPVPADGQLGPHRDAEGQERGQRARGRGQARPDLLRRLQRVTGQARAGEPGQQAAAGHVRGAPPRPGLLGELRDEQFGELIAIAGPPRAGYQRSSRAARRAGASRGAVTVCPSRSARRRSPTSATRRWSSRCARSAGGARGGQPVGPAAVLALQRLDQALALEPAAAPRTACPARA